MRNEIETHLKTVFELSDEDVAEFYAAFLESLDDCCRQLEEAGEPLDFAKVRVASHTLIGFTGNAGAAELLEASRKLNAVAKAADAAACRDQINEILRLRSICRQDT